MTRLKHWLAALAISWGSVGAATAQEGTTVYLPPGQEVLVTAPLTVGNPQAIQPPHSKLQGCLNKHGLSCESHHSWFGCGNLRSEATFIFGSCRSFFGEPCQPKTPTPHPVLGRLNPLNYGYRGNSKAGCANCNKGE